MATRLIDGQSIKGLLLGDKAAYARDDQRNEWILNICVHHGVTERVSHKGNHIYGKWFKNLCLIKMSVEEI